jgi:4'-phosphopantetheinyl transferase
MPGPQRDVDGRAIVSVWWATPADVRPRLKDLLDPAEQSRLAAYHRAEDADRFLVGAALLRLLAGQRLGRPAADVSIQRGCPTCGRPHGKPRLPAPLQASVSHSGQRIGVAMAVHDPVGLDVEMIDEQIHDALVEHVLGFDERASLNQSNDRRALFTRYWARKEAVLKCTGDGLRIDPRELQSSAPHAPAELITWAGREELIAKLRLVDLRVEGGYEAALAVLRPGPVRVDEQDATELLARA